MAALFANAPISLATTVMTVVFTTLWGRSAPATLDLSRVLSGDIGHALASVSVFNSMSQAVVAAIALATCRVFERQMGSKKYPVFLITTGVLSATFSVISISLSSLLGYSLRPSSGPFFLVFAQLPYFHKYIPKLRTTQFRLFGLIEVGEKSWFYLLAAQLALSNGTHSLAAALPGVLAGLLYDRSPMLQRLRLPTVIESVFGRCFSFFESIIPTGGPPPRAGPGGNMPRPMATRTPMPPPVVQPLDENAVATLMTMGFERAAVERALRTSGNNVEAAANILLSG